MIPLVLYILCSSLIFVAFKLFDRFKINTFQAIVFNYFTAFIIGVGLYGNEWNPEALNASAWIYFAVLASMLFISLFILMGLSSQRNGVASTSIAVKMSMAFSMLLMIIGYGEDISVPKIIGILLAITGVLHVSIEKQSETKSSNSWMLIVLFLGSGGLDFVLNYAQKNILGALTPSLFSAFGLGLAGVFGSSILLYRLIRKKDTLAFKNIIAGIILGIPNYFSIYLLLLSYKTTGLKDSSVLAITNVGVVLTSSIFGFLVFRESHNTKKIIGLIAALSAIVSLYFAN